MCYWRVSGCKQKDDLRRQAEYMRGRFPEAEIIRDVGSGVRRKDIKTVLERATDGDKLGAVSAHKDRLSRFGTDLVRRIIDIPYGKLVVLDKSDISPGQEPVQDLLTVLHVFSCRMHGLRGYKNKIGEAFSDKSAEKDI
ncbi:recombinase family protein [Desulfobacterales bacterium HSG2]|nr:recombinase family protein [Desulfobacterales bacterium HSG2]